MAKHKSRNTDRYYPNQDNSRSSWLPRQSNPPSGNGGYDYAGYDDYDMGEGVDGLHQANQRYKQPLGYRYTWTPKYNNWNALKGGGSSYGWSGWYSSSFSSPKKAIQSIHRNASSFIKDSSIENLAIWVNSVQKSRSVKPKSYCCCIDGSLYKQLGMSEAQQHYTVDIIAQVLTYDEIGTGAAHATNLVQFEESSYPGLEEVPIAIRELVTELVRRRGMELLETEMPGWHNRVKAFRLAMSMPRPEDITKEPMAMLMHAVWSMTLPEAELAADPELLRAVLALRLIEAEIFKTLPDGDAPLVAAVLRATSIKRTLIRYVFGDSPALRVIESLEKCRNVVAELHTSAQQRSPSLPSSSDACMPTAQHIRDLADNASTCVTALKEAYQLGITENPLAPTSFLDGASASRTDWYSTDLPDKGKHLYQLDSAKIKRVSMATRVAWTLEVASGELDSLTNVAGRAALIDDHRIQPRQITELYLNQINELLNESSNQDSDSGANRALSDFKIDRPCRTGEDGDDIDSGGGKASQDQDGDGESLEVNPSDGKGKGEGEGDGQEDGKERRKSRQTKLRSERGLHNVEDLELFDDTSYEDTPQLKYDDDEDLTFPDVRLYDISELPDTTTNTNLNE